MNTQPANQNDPQANIELRMRTMRTLWIGLMMSVVMYYVFTFFARRSGEINPNNTLSLVLVVAAFLITLISFPIKSKLVARAVEQQQVQLVQQGYILAWALCEVPALLGLFDYYATGNRFFYVLFIISACAQLLHFPRREHVINASFKHPPF